MSIGNFNLKINVEDLPGARVMDLQVGEGRTLTCACIPVDNFKGFCTNAYVTSRNEVRSTKKTTLNFAAYELSESRYGDTHCLRAQLSRDAMSQMSEESVKRHEQICGYMRPWSQKGQSSPGVEPAAVGNDEYWGRNGRNNKG